jgi:phosphinothricin acetyltransferase
VDKEVSQTADAASRERPGRHTEAMQIRPADPAQDAAACAAIYAPYVSATTVSFELDPPSTSDMADRMASAIDWIVAVEDDRVVGYAYAGRFHPRAAYRWACEVSVYLDEGLRGGGRGRRLYEALFERLSERGYRMACACITIPNDPSVRLHSALGFSLVGTFRDIGWKNGSWRDVCWMQRPLGQDGPPLAEPA